MRRLQETLWVHEAPFKLIGIDFGNRMSCIKLKDGSLCLHSPTRFRQKDYDALSAMGNIKYLIAPSRMHNLFVMDWKSRAREAQVIAPSKAKKVNADIELDRLSPEEIVKVFDGDISCIPIKGAPVLEEYAFIHHASKTLLLTDLAFNFGKGVGGWAGVFLKLYGAYGKFSPTRTVRALIRDKAAFSASLQKIFEHEFDRIIVSHGDIIETNGPELLKRAFRKYIESSAVLADI